MDLVLSAIFHIIMVLGAVTAVIAVVALWVCGLIAIFDEAAEIEHPLIRNIINKIEEIRNALP